MKPTVWRIIKWTAGAALISVIVWLNRDELRLALSQRFDVLALLFSGLICLAGVIITFFRWFLLVRAQSLPFKELDALRLGFIGYFFNMVLPGSISGDLIKAGFIAKEQKRRTAAVATIVVDRIVGLLGLAALVSVLGAFFWPQARDVPALRNIVLFVWALTAGAVVAITLLAVLPVPAEPKPTRWLGRVGKLVVEVGRSLHLYRHQSRTLGYALALAVLGHAGFVLSVYFSARAVPGDTPPVHEHYLIIPVGMVVQSVPLTPGNLGVNEGAFEYLYNLLPASSGESYKGKGILTCLAQRLVTWSVALIGLVFYLSIRRKVQQVITDSQAEIQLEGIGMSNDEAQARGQIPDS